MRSRFWKVGGCANDGGVDIQMAAVDDFEQVVEQYQRSLGEVVKGNPEPQKKLWSHREDVTLANPLGPPVRGWEQVAAAADRAVSNLRDGERVDFESVAKYVTPECDS